MRIYCSCVNCFEIWCNVQSAVWLSKIRRLWNSAFFLKHKFHQITLHSSEIRGLRSMKMSRRPLFYFYWQTFKSKFSNTWKIKTPSHPLYLIQRVLSYFVYFFPEKTTKMASQIYKNTTEEWSEKLLQCPYDPVHQIRPERFRYDFTI